jgi:hypothetical protein
MHMRPRNQYDRVLHARGPILGSLSNECRDQGGDFVCVRVERKMSRLQKMHLGTRHVSPIGLGFGNIEGRIVLAPNHEHRGLILSHPCLRGRIRGYVGAIVIKQIALYVRLIGLAEKRKLISPQR